MQINNRTHKREIAKHGISYEDVINDACINVYVGAWLLKKRIIEANNDFWVGVGNYHSRTPKFHNRYKKKVYQNAMRFRKHINKMSEKLALKVQKNIKNSDI